MSRDVKAIPDGQRTVTPSLVARDAAKAIDFYERAFSAVEVARMCCPQTGKVMHAELIFGDSRLYLADEMPSWGTLSPESLGGSPVTIHLYVEDADATQAQAVEAGATVIMPVSEMFWGDRFGKLSDPFGHVWSVSTHVENLTFEQMTERMATAFAPAS